MPPDAVLGRRHAKHIGRLLIEAAAGLEAGIVDRRGHAVAGYESLADLRGAMRFGILLWREARDGFEKPMKVSLGCVRPRPARSSSEGSSSLVLNHAAGLARQAWRSLHRARGCRGCSACRDETPSLSRPERLVKLDVLWVGPAARGMTGGNRRPSSRRNTRTAHRPSLSRAIMRAQRGSSATDAGAGFFMASSGSSCRFVS